MTKFSQFNYAAPTVESNVAKTKRSNQCSVFDRSASGMRIGSEDRDLCDAVPVTREVPRWFLSCRRAPWNKSLKNVH